MGRSGCIDRVWRCACATAAHAQALIGKKVLRPIVLASTSPRRIDILTRSGVAFRAVAPRIDERSPAPLGPLRYVAWAAAAKANAVAIRTPGAIVVAADTEVVRDGRIYGKPNDRRQAAAFLRSLAGRRHQVYTAVHVIDGRSGCQASGISRTDVTMRELSAGVIEAYVRTGEAQDKAGAYAIQGEGHRLVRSIRGPYDNVVGMPMRLLTRLLAECGIPLPLKNPDEPKVTEKSRKPSRRQPAAQPPRTRRLHG
jgi:septum formation protein